MRTALIATVVFLGPLAACGNGAVPADAPAAGSPTAGSPTVSAAASRRVTATPEGLAAAVISHLDGWEVVEASGGLTDMEDTRELSVDLRLGNADGRHNRLSIQAPDPAYLPGDREVDPCVEEGRVAEGEGASECRTLPDGATVQLVSMPYGFSDDNADGSATVVMLGGADRELTIMWETYDAGATLPDAVLMEIATDPLVGWTTSAAHNAEGERIEGFRADDRVDRDGEDGYDDSSADVELAP